MQFLVEMHRGISDLPLQYSGDGFLEVKPLDHADINSLVGEFKSVNAIPNILAVALKHQKL